MIETTQNDSGMTILGDRVQKKFNLFSKYHQPISTVKA